MARSSKIKGLGVDVGFGAPRWNTRLRRGALLLGLCLSVACSAQRRYRTLSFFFDGVPDPNAAPEPSPSEQDMRLASLEQGSRRARVPEFNEVVHEPVAMNQCGRCHLYSSQIGNESGPYKFGALRTMGASGSGLVQPLQTLCVSCHTAFSAETAVDQHLWLHGPVGAGACVYCHDPHRSKNDSLLRAAAPQQLCVQCHTADSLTTHPQLTDDRDCTACHDPHMGASRFLN